ncbi:MAG: zinc/iron-chelating domain-containing protein [Planctomycetota bacterium]|nr:MAG: zinc/iron-chelating domain-containing protein [Planctomycetota bacterium]
MRGREMFGRGKEKWYADGLQFSCTQCGNCCSGPPGYVWVTKEDIRAIAAHLGREDGTLDRSEVRGVGGRYSLTEKPGGDCIFLERRDGKAYCSVYPVRPIQCRTWPFWDELLKSRRTWDDAAKTCPGMNRGPHYGFVAIEELRIRNRPGSS